MRNSSETLAGRYHLGEVIGLGGMGTVVRGHDEVLDRPVAIKLLKEELATDAHTVERFRREARIVAGLSHPGIASVFDFGEEDGRFFIVMELLDGQDLHAVLSRQGKMDPAVAAGLIVQAADALHHAHVGGAVHRDVKPGNIFLTRLGRVKVTDFGIASAASLAPVTVTGSVLGTPFYISPEQVAGERATPASDVYSLGCVLFQLLTGRPPYEGEGFVAVAQAHVAEPVPGPRDADPSIPEELDAVVRRAMAKDPAARFASAEEMARALRTALGQGPASDPVLPGPATVAFEAGPPTAISPPTPPETPPERRPPRGAAVPAAPARRRSGRPLLAVALLALGVLGLVGLSRLLRDRAAEPPPAVLPSWIGAGFDQAKAEAEKLGLKVEKVDVSSDQPAGAVLSQEPPPNAPVRPGSLVRLTASLGNQVRVPDLVGISVEEAVAALERAGLKAVLPKDIEDDDGVVGQSVPAETLVARGSSVMLTVVHDEDRRGKGKGRG